MKSIIDEPPTKGKFVALYNDGSGAELFVALDKNELMDCEGDTSIKLSTLSDSFSHWYPVPDEYEFWFESEC